jgi:hypothetical protein
MQMTLPLIAVCHPGHGVPANGQVAYPVDLQRRRLVGTRPSRGIHAMETARMPFVSASYTGGAESDANRERQR